MHWATLDDGRTVVVHPPHPSSPIMRKVKGEEYFVDPDAYSEVLLEGSWHIIRNSRLRKLVFGHPFEVLK